MTSDDVSWWRPLLQLGVAGYADERHSSSGLVTRPFSPLSQRGPGLERMGGERFGLARADLNCEKGCRCADLSVFLRGAAANRKTPTARQTPSHQGDREAVRRSSGQAPFPFVSRGSYPAVRHPLRTLPEPVPLARCVSSRRQGTMALPWPESRNVESGEV